MKIYLVSIGCRLNQAELEHYAHQFRAAGHTLVASPEEADLAVINTCTVTSAAAADSRAKIRQSARAGIEEIIETFLRMSEEGKDNLTFTVRISFCVDERNIRSK